MYTSCQKCTQRVNCDKCENKISKKMNLFSNLENFLINIPRKEISFEIGHEKEDDVLDYLEDMGVFVD
jgi:hypothetical protein